MTTLEELRATFRSHLFLPDVAVVDFTAAVVVANSLTGDALWALIIGASGAGKTEAVLSVGDIPGVHALSTLTKNTLMSGGKLTFDEDGVAIPERDPSLLIRMNATGESLLAFKDFTTVLEMDRHDRAAIMAQLREVYDGSVVKEFGNSKTVEWHGRIGFLAGVTPIIDTHHAITSVLGERFIYLRLAPSDRVTIADRASAADNDEGMHLDLRVAMRRFIAEVVAKVRADGGAPDITDDTRGRLVAIANMATWARSGVPRDAYSRDILMRPSLEVPTRFTKQLVTLWAALAAMSHDDPVALCERVARDSMPRDRWDVLAYLDQYNVGTTTELRMMLGLPKRTTTRILEDLVALDIIEVIIPGNVSSDGETWSAHTYAMTSDARTTWATAFPDCARNVYLGVGRGVEEGSMTARGIHEPGAVANDEVPF